MFELENSPLCHPHGKKRSLDELVTPGFQRASQVFPKAKKSLNKTPVPDKSTPNPVFKRSFLNKLEKTEILETPGKEVCLPDISTDFINFDIDGAPALSQRILIKSNSVTSEIQYSQRTGAHYVQRQRTMVNKNEENIIDDDISLCQNSQVYTSQFRRDLERVFDDCEKSILQKKEVHDEVKGISSIDWGDDDFGTEAPVAKTQSSHGRHQLRPISSANFSEIGPFFGLPNKVKMLIKEFKGIEELYGKFPSFTALLIKFDQMLLFLRLAKGMLATQKYSSTKQPHLRPSNEWRQDISRRNFDVARDYVS